MNAPTNKLLVSLILLVIALTGSFARANTLEELARAGHIQVGVSVHPESGVVPGQKAQLVIEIATDTWFTGGTRITPPEIPGLVILQNEQFASNATEVRSGTTWVVQRWTLDIFPQREGSYTIQPARLNIKTKSNAGEDIEGELFTPTTRLEVVLPPELAGLDNWVASPAFSVNREFDKHPDELKVGDAIALDITIQATDVMAMMLPEISYNKPEGMSVYPAPPSLESSNNRGSLTATRSQGLSYVAEKRGSYTIPAEVFFWWDTASQELKTVSLPQVDFVVDSAVFNTASGSSSAAQTLLYRAAALLILFVLLGWIYTRLPDLPRKELQAAFNRLRAWIIRLRKPALPSSLNPGSSAGD